VSELARHFLKAKEDGTFEMSMKMLALFMKGGWCSRRGHVHERTNSVRLRTMRRIAQATRSQSSSGKYDRSSLGTCAKYTCPTQGHCAIQSQHML
jgi:hypothetical protein